MNDIIYVEPQNCDTKGNNCDYYVYVDDTDDVIGPYTANELKRRRSIGVLSGSSQVWKDSRESSWVNAESLSELNIPRDDRSDEIRTIAEKTFANILGTASAAGASTAFHSLLRKTLALSILEFEDEGEIDGGEE